MAHGRKDGINENDANRWLLLSPVGMLLTGNKPPTSAHSDLHPEISLLVIEGGKMQIWIDNLNRAGNRDVSCCNLACSQHVEMHQRWTVGITAKTQLFEVLHEIRNIFLHMWNILEFVLHPVNPHGGDSGPRQ